MTQYLMTDEFWLTERIGEAIRECLEEGFELPVYAAIVASDGGCAFFRFIDAGDDESVVPELMTQHLSERGMSLPVNIMFSDPAGHAARMLIETTDTIPALKVLG
jgi:hypothetical protein